MKPDRRLKHLKLDDIRAAIVAMHGNLHEVARHFGVRVDYLRVHARNRPILWKAIEECREQWKDLAKRNYVKDLLAGDPRATYYTLATLCRDEGFGPLNGNGNGSDIPTSQLRITTVNINPVAAGVFVPEGSPSVTITQVEEKVDPEDDPDATLDIEEDNSVIEGEVVDDEIVDELQLFRQKLDEEPEPEAMRDLHRQLDS